VDTSFSTDLPLTPTCVPYFFFLFIFRSLYVLPPRFNSNLNPNFSGFNLFLLGAYRPIRRCHGGHILTPTCVPFFFLFCSFLGTYRPIRGCHGGYVLPPRAAALCGAQRPQRDRLAHPDIHGAHHKAQAREALCGPDFDGTAHANRPRR